MTQAAFKLESFSDAPRLPRAMVDAEAVQQAYRDGLAEGRAAGFSAELRGLTDAIIAFEAQLADAGQIRASAYGDALSALAPLVNEIVAALSEGDSSALLERALTLELHKIVSAAPPVGWHVLCPPGMEPVIRRCAAAAGSSTPDIRPMAGTLHAQIVMDQGRIAFSKTQVAARFRDLISELQESLS